MISESYKKQEVLSQGLLAEILGTFFLVHTVLLTAVDDSKWHAPLAIGLTLTVDIFIA